MSSKEFVNTCKMTAVAEDSREEPRQSWAVCPQYSVCSLTFPNPPYCLNWTQIKVINSAQGPRADVTWVASRERQRLYELVHLFQFSLLCIYDFGHHGEGVAMR